MSTPSLGLKDNEANSAIVIAALEAAWREVPQALIDKLIVTACIFLGLRQVARQDALRSGCSKTVG